MRTVTRWEPVGELVSLREMMNKLFEDSFVRPPAWPADGTGTRTLPIDLHETPDEFVVSASVPGVKPEELDITVTGDTLQLKGETKAESKTEETSYLRKERHYGSFYRELALPTEVQSGKAEATFDNGILTVKLPKVDEVKPKRIKVNVS